MSMPKAMSDEENMQTQMFGTSQTGKTEENLKANDILKMRRLSSVPLKLFSHSI